MGTKSLRIWVVLAAGAAMVLAGCASTPEVDQGEVKAAIVEAFDAYLGALNTGNGELWLSLWDEDGIQMPPGAPARGKDVLSKAIPAGLKALTFNMSIDVEEVVAAGPWAYARGTYTDTRVPKAGGDAIHIDGKFLTIFRRQPDGSWKIYRDCFNSNVP